MRKKIDSTLYHDDAIALFCCFPRVGNIISLYGRGYIITLLIFSTVLSVGAHQQRTSVAAQISNEGRQYAAAAATAAAPGHPKTWRHFAPVHLPYIFFLTKSSIILTCIMTQTGENH